MEIFHSKLLVNVSIICFMTPANHQFQVYKHIFTSPSSVKKESKATWSGKACLHGMMSVPPTSIACIATQVCCDRAGCPVPASGAFLTCSSLHNQAVLAFAWPFQHGDESCLRSSYTPCLTNRCEWSFDETRTTPTMRN